MSRRRLELQPVGGLGRFGANCMLIRAGEEAILVDLGWRPPDADLPGVEGELPDLERLDWQQFRLHGVVLTHGHEDHIGAVPHTDLRGVGVYGTRYTLAILRRKLDRLHRPRFDGPLHELKDGGKPTQIGPFEIQPIATTHSIPDAQMLQISIDGWTVLHTGDFKLGPDTDDSALKALGKTGVDLMLCDSTNADVPGETPAERLAAERILHHVRQASGTVLLTTFSSHISRIVSTLKAAQRCERKVLLVGASIIDHVAIAEQLSRLRFPAGVRVAPETFKNLPRDRRLVIAAGTQGEPRSALSRISRGEHPDYRAEQGDLLLHSARMIPGNTEAIEMTLDRFRRMGVEVVTRRDDTIHVSGHPCHDDVKTVFDWVQPRNFLPVHGNYGQLRAAQEIAIASGLSGARTTLAEDGDYVSLTEDGLHRRPGIGRCVRYVDEKGRPVGTEPLFQRRWMARAGVVIVAISIDGPYDTRVALEWRGFEGRPMTPRLIRQAKRVIVEALNNGSAKKRADREWVVSKSEATMKRWIRRELEMQPLVIAVLMGPQD